VNQLQEQQLRECTTVLGMMDSEGWRIVTRDAQANFDAISQSWFDYPDGSNELKAARSTQIANRIILNLRSMYEAKLHEVGMEVIAKENPDLIQTTEVDNSDVEEDDNG